MGAESSLEGVGPLQPIAKAIVGPFLRPYYRMDVRGEEHVPGGGQVIIAANHESMWDIPLLVVACPRPITFMAKEGVFDNPFKEWFFTRLGGFPLAREQPDVSAVKTSLKVLREGRALGLFPEGTRTPGRIGPFRTGAARISLTAGAPIVPAGIVGTDRIWPKGSIGPRPVPVRVRFGAPITAEPRASGRARRDQVAKLTDRLRDEVATLLEA